MSLAENIWSINANLIFMSTRWVRGLGLLECWKFVSLAPIFYISHSTNEFRFLQIQIFPIYRIEIWIPKNRIYFRYMPPHRSFPWSQYWIWFTQKLIENWKIRKEVLNNAVIVVSDNNNKYILFKNSDSSNSKFSLYISFRDICIPEDRFYSKYIFPRW